jgi:outer membrane receptor protein involved in Fe transport
MSSKFKFVSLSTVSVFCLAISISGQAAAQDTDSGDETSQQNAANSQRRDAPIVVTGSRIVNVGMDAPTPVTAVESAELEALSPSTLISAISQLPQFYGNNTNDVRSGFFSSPGAGNLNLRGLNTGGSGRTLTLLNGRRVVPATGFGSVDINILPSALMKRIETVTGGASAAYGTDAVAGAVNFILDTDYTGLQASIQGGITSRGDRENFLASGSWGTRIGDNMHLLLSGEYYHADRVTGLSSRDWYQGYSLINNPNTDPTTPRYLSLPNVVSSIATFGGLINSGVPTNSALYRQYFNPDGTLSPFVLGTGTATQAHSITNGGSGDDTTDNLGTLAPEAERYNGFVYLDFDATPNLNLFVQGLIGKSMTDQPDHGGRFAAVPGIDTRITIFRENPFIPAGVAAIMDNEGLTSFQMNLVGDREGLGRTSRLKQDNLTYSGTIGFQWDISEGLFDGWRVDGYAQYGHADNRGYQEGMIFDKFFAAVDAVKDGSGNIVCYAALQNPANWGDCVPLNLFGRGNASDAAIAYVTHFEEGQTITTPLYFQPDEYQSGQSVTYTSGPGKVYNTGTTQILADLSASGKLFDGWAGPVQVAFGASYRKESIEQIVYDPSNPSSDPAIRPAQLAQNAGELRAVPTYARTRSSMVQNSTVANVHGSYEVKEAFVELQIPLLSDVPLFQQLNLLGAARYAEYTGSGGVWSWKTGLDWQVFEDLRLRGTVSRDLRAATLLERFNQTGGVGTVSKDPAFPNDGTQTFSSRTGGNPDLGPETSTTYTYGLVYQPSWLPGFSTSIDYWDVDIAGAIGLLGFTRIVEDCFASPGSSLCDLITRDGTTGRLSQVRNITQNIAAAAGRGLDVEVSYRFPLHLISNNDSLSFRVFWSHLIENSTTTDRSNLATYFDSSNQTGVGVLPEDAVTAIQSFRSGNFNLSLTERYISSGNYNNRYNLPGARPDVEDNTVPAVIYFNLSASHSWDFAGGDLELFGNIQNLFDKNPPITPTVFDAVLGQTGNQVNARLFDLLGRRFTLGVRVKY